MNNNLIIKDFSSPVGSLEAYIAWANKIPMLSLEEEQSLAKRLHDEQDLEAARALVLSHLRFVVKIARSYSGYGLNQSDLIQEGNIGLMKAVKRFDPSKGVRLVTFAVHWIKAEIHEFILKNWRIVKVATTKAQRKLFFNLRSSKARLGWMNQEEVQDVAKVLGVSSKDVMEMEARMNHFHDTSFDADEEDDENYLAPASYLEAPNADPSTLLENKDWGMQKSEALLSAFESLDARSRDILEQRWLKESKVTLQDLAEKYAISLERVRQLEANALKKLRAKMDELEAA